LVIGLGGNAPGVTEPQLPCKIPATTFLHHMNGRYKLVDVQPAVGLLIYWLMTILQAKL
jgi:hypothetical protein